MNNTQMMLMTAGIYPPLHSKYVEQVVADTRVVRKKQPYERSGRVGDMVICHFCKGKMLKTGGYQKYHPECAVKSTVERARQRHIRKMLARAEAR